MTHCTTSYSTVLLCAPLRPRAACSLIRSCPSRQSFVSLMCLDWFASVLGTSYAWAPLDGGSMCHGSVAYLACPILITPPLGLKLSSLACAHLRDPYFLFTLTVSIVAHAIDSDFSGSSFTLPNSMGGLLVFLVEWD
jgi:hypothetical protein